jgi:hypothetical protein
MCAPSAPKIAKTPAVEPIPDRQPLLLPDGGDPSVRAGLGSGNGKLRTSAMIFANRSGTLNAPSIAAPLGTRGY